MALIAVGTDLSTRSDRALRRAIMLALAHSLELVLVHVLDDQPDASITDEGKRSAERIAEACRTIKKWRAWTAAPTFAVVRSQSNRQMPQRPTMPRSY